MDFLLYGSWEPLDGCKILVQALLRVSTPGQPNSENFFLKMFLGPLLDFCGGAIQNESYRSRVHGMKGHATVLKLMGDNVIVRPEGTEIEVNLLVSEVNRVSDVSTPI